MSKSIRCWRPAVCLMAMSFATPLSLVSQESRLVGRFSDDVHRQLQHLLDSAQGVTLPSEPLIDRALEGAAKGAPGDLIVRAVERLFGELQVARTALGPSATAPELSGGASAVRAGATSEDLARLRDLRGERSLTVAASILADLVALGVPADTAVAAVFALSPVPDEGFVAFHRNVARDIELGTSPSTAVGVNLRSGDIQGINLNLANAASAGSSSQPRKIKP